MKRDYIYGTIIVILCLCVGYSFWKRDNTTPQPDISNPSTEIKPTIPVKCPDTGLLVIEKEKLAKKLEEQDSIIKKMSSWLSEKGDVEKLPDWLKDKDVYVLADKTLPPWEGKTYVVSTLNSKTGEGGISYKNLDIPYIGFPNKLKFSLGYFALGNKSGDFQAEIDYTPVRIGNIYITGFGQMDSGSRVGIKIEYSK